MLLGHLRRKMREHDTARKLLTEAVTQDPGFFFAWLERLGLEVEAEDWGTAQVVLDEAEASFGTRNLQSLCQALHLKIHNR